MKKPEEIGSLVALPGDHLARLTPKQAKAIPLLAVGTAAAHVAKVIHVSPGQMSEWKKNPAFMQALAEARRNTIREAEHELVSLAREAVKTLRELMLESPNELIRLRATALVFTRLDAWAARDLDEAGTDSGYGLREVLLALAPSP